MKLLEEIREKLASSQGIGTTAFKIESLPEDCSAFIIRIPDGYGVAIPVSDEMEVAERFNSCNFRTGTLSLNGFPANYLMLISAFEEYRYEFASLCAEFVDSGKDGVNRQSILQNPLDWWENWRGLVGNTNKDKRVYNVIAEMMVLEHKLKTDPSAEWTATRMGSHDIECDSESCEVKSTCKRYGAEVVIAGQHQLEHNKPLFLYFCRMEESLEGVSINDMQKRLANAGYDAGKLEIEIEGQGFERGSSIRNKKYKFLEKRKFAVDESFPAITKHSFKTDCFPVGIVHIQYTVDLDILNYTAW